MDNAYLNIFGDILDELRSIGRKVDENSKAIVELRTDMNDLRTELKADINNIRTEMNDLRTELKAEMNDLRTELRAEIKANTEDIMNQTSDLALEIIQTTDKYHRSNEKRIERLELATFGQVCKVNEPDDTTYECK